MYLTFTEEVDIDRILKAMSDSEKNTMRGCLECRDSTAFKDLQRDLSLAFFKDDMKKVIEISKKLNEIYLEQR